MKKFIGYITIGVSALIAIAVGVMPTIKNINGNIDYARSRQYVYKISDRIVEDSDDKSLVESNYNNLNDSEKQDILDEVVDSFKDRLDVAQINEYNLETDGFDTIKVTFRADNQMYDDISSYLSFNWSFMATTYGNEPNIVLGDDAASLDVAISSDRNDGVVNVDDITDGRAENLFINPGNARVEYRNGYPYVVVKLANPEEFKKLYTTAHGDSGESEGESSGTPSSLGLQHSNILKEGETTDGEETETTVADKNKIFILNDWLTGFSIEDLIENGGTENLLKENLKNHILFGLDATNPANIYWDYNAEDNQEETVYEEIYFGGYDVLTDSNSNTYYGTAVSDETLAYKKANIWAGKLNATTFKYQITLTNQGGNYGYTETLDPGIEYLVRNQKIQMSSLLVATIIAIVIVTLFTTLNFGASGLMGVISSLGILLSSLSIFNLLGVEFNIGAIIALLALVAIATFSSTFFFTKIKNEIYLGKNFKKSYQDGSKKAFWYTLDSSIVGLVLGLIAYLMPSTIMLSFGSILIIGSCFNLVFNGVFLRAVSYLLYNSSLVSNNPRIIACEPKLIPNLLNDETPKYFDIYKVKQTKSTKKITSIVGLILMVVSLVGIVTFQSINGNIYTEDLSTRTSQYYVETVINSPDNNLIDNTIKDNVSAYEDVLATLTFENKDGAKVFKDIEIKTYYYQYKESGAENRVYYYVLDLNSYYDLESDTENPLTYAYSLDKGATYETASGLNTALNIISERVLKQSGNIKNTINVENDTANLYTLIFVAISLGIVGVYFLFRFGPSKTISAIVLVGGTILITIGLFTLIRAPFSSVITYGALFIAVFAYLAIDSYFIAQKEIYNDNKRELKNNYELRKEKFEFAINVANQSVTTFGLLSSFVILSLFLANGVNSMMLLLTLIGMLLFVLFAKILSLPIEIGMNNLFIGAREKIKNHNSKKVRKVKENKIEEGPEEAIFPGIND